MKRLIRPLAAALAIVFLFCALPVQRAAAANGTSLPSAWPNKRAFTFQWGGDNGDNPDHCYYTDDYFKYNATLYNPSLGTMSLSLAMAAYGSTAELAKTPPDYANQSKNGLKLLEDIGFSDRECNEAYKHQPTLDSIGVVIGWKTIQDYSGADVTLLAVGLRGGNYQAEWGGNFTIGTGTDAHKGFNDAADQVLAFIKQYIARKNLGNQSIKLWITGFSRAAATSNLTAAKLDQAIHATGTSGIIGANLAKEDLYAYTFDTPAGYYLPDYLSSDKERFANIFNIVNPHDLVPMVAPASLADNTGFGRYGVTKVLPCAETNASYAGLMNEMLTHYRPVDAGAYALETYTPYRLKYKKVLGKYIPIGYEKDPNGTQVRGIYTQQFIDNFATMQIRDRDNFVNAAKLQDAIRTTVRTLMIDAGTLSSWQAARLLIAFIDKATDHLLEIILDIFQEDENALGDVIKTVVKKTLAAANIPALPPDKLSEVGKALAKLIYGLAHSNPDMLLTVALNYEEILQAHSPELAKAWMESMDVNHAGTLSANSVFLCGEYRTVRVAGDVTVRIFNGTTLSASVSPGETPVAEMSMRDNQLTSNVPSSSGIVTGQSLDNEMTVYLPVNAGYRIAITASQDATCLYSVAEYSAQYSKYKRMCYTYPVHLTSSDVLVSNIPAFTAAESKIGILEGSTYDYQLYDTAGHVIPASQDIRGYDMVNGRSKYSRVTIQEVNPEYGATWGEGVRAIGTQATVRAIPLEGAEFLGWYTKASDRRITTDFDYTFPIEAGDPSIIMLVAKFSAVAPDPDDGEGIPDTGDRSPIFPLFGILLAAGASLILIRRRHRRQR